VVELIPLEALLPVLRLEALSRGHVECEISEHGQFLGVAREEAE